MTHDAMAGMWVDINQLQDARACLYGVMELMHCLCVYYKGYMHKVFGDLIMANWTRSTQGKLPFLQIWGLDSGRVDKGLLRASFHSSKSRSKELGCTLRCVTTKLHTFMTLYILHLC